MRQESIQQIGVAVIGAGIMGQKHLAALRLDERAHIVGIADVSEDAARELADTCGASVATSDYRELLARDDIDFVSIATPDNLHAQVCGDAARAGKHFMVEKPLTTDLADADALVAEVERAGIRAMVSFNHRWIPSYFRAKELITSGQMGTPVMAYARKNDRIFVPTRMLRWAGNTTCAWFLSSHDIDLVSWFFDADATSVYATASDGVLRARGIETHDAIQAQVRFEGGKIATFESCWIYPDTYPTMTDSFIEVVGTNGVAHLPRTRDQLEFTSDASFEFPRTSPGYRVHGEEQGAVVAALRHMVTCIIDDKEPLITLRSSRNVTAVLEALHRSIASGTVEPVQPFTERSL